MQDFKRLHAWQRAHAFSLAIHETVRGFPRGCESNLRGQLIRSADSIATNIVEGCGSATQREFGRYLDISIKSTNETEYHLLAARDRAAIDFDAWRTLNDEVCEIRRMIYGLRERVLGDDARRTR